MDSTVKFVQNAQNYCEEHGYRFTEPRRLVLEILAKNRNPIGAYEILDQLGEYRIHPKPPTAYRAIDFWRDHGFVHKIESMNAYVVCCEGHTHQNTHFLICDGCNKVKELHMHGDEHRNIPSGFKVTKMLTETHGICQDCVA